MRCIAWAFHIKSQKVFTACLPPLPQEDFLALKAPLLPQAPWMDTLVLAHTAGAPPKQLLKGASSAQALSNVGSPSFGLHVCLTGEQGEQGHSPKLYNKPKSLKTSTKGKIQRGLIAKPKQHWCATEVCSSSI